MTCLSSLRIFQTVLVGVCLMLSTVFGEDSAVESVVESAGIVQVDSNVIESDNINIEQIQLHNINDDNNNKVDEDAEQIGSKMWVWGGICVSLVFIAAIALLIVTIKKVRKITSENKYGEYGSYGIGNEDDPSKRLVTITTIDEPTLLADSENEEYVSI